MDAEPIYKQLNIDPYEGLLCAYLPKLDGGLMHEEQYDDNILFSLRVDDQYTLIDVMPTKGTMKWWRVKLYARGHGYDIIQPFWSGPACDFAVHLLPDVPQPENTNLAIRQFSRGPWIVLPKKEKEQA